MYLQLANLTRGVLANSIATRNIRVVKSEAKVTLAVAWRAIVGFSDP